MPPRAQAKAQGKAKAAAAKRPSAAKTRRNAQVATSNARRDGRRAALRALNGLAREVGIRQLPHLIAHKASPTPAVDRIMRLLDVRCGDDARGPRLRAAAEQWVANGGTLAEPLLPLPAPAALGGPALVPAHRQRYGRCGK